MAIIKREGFPRDGMSFGAVAGATDPAKNTERFDLNEYEQAALMALLRLVVKEGGRFEYAAQLLLWTIESNSCIDVADEGIEACLDGYVKWCDIEAGL